MEINFGPEYFKQLEKAPPDVQAEARQTVERMQQIAAALPEGATIEDFQKAWDAAVPEKPMKES